MRSHTLPQSLLTVLIGLALVTYAWLQFDGNPPPELHAPDGNFETAPPLVFDGNPSPNVYAPGGMFRVQRVVDGDTLLLENRVRVRLLGVDTPETKHPDRPVEPLGPEATEFTRRWIAARRIKLEFDRERQDRYGRTLAYVYADDAMLNEAIIRAGYSRAETRFPFSSEKKRRFREAEADARAARRGLWAESAP